MKTFLNIARCLALTTLAAGASFISYDLHLALKGVQSDLAQLHSTLAKADSAVDQLHDAANNEQRYYDQGARQMAGSLKALRLFIDRTDKSLNDERGTFAVLNQAIQNVNTDSDQLTRQADSSIAEATSSATEALSSLNRSALSLDALLAGPQLQGSLTNLNAISGHLNVISGNAEAMSQDMKLAVHRMAQPPSKLHTILDMSYTTAKFGSLFIP